MEYTSNTKPVIRREIDPEYEIIIKYSKYSSGVPDHEYTARITDRIIKTLSCGMLFRIVCTKIERTETDYGYRSLYCCVGLSGSLPTAGAAFYLSKITTALYRVLRNETGCDVWMRCVATDREVTLFSPEHTYLDHVKSSDIAAVKW